MICLRSHYQLEGRLPLGIQLANKIRDRPSQSPTISNSRVSSRLRSAAEVDQSGLAKLTGLDTPSVGAIEQSIFYVNQVMQFGKLLAVFQQYPADPNRTVASIYLALGIESNILDKKKEYSADSGASKSRACPGA